MVSSQVGDTAAAKALFAVAIKSDALAQLPDRGTSPNIRALWKEAVATTPGGALATHEYAVRLADAAGVAAKGGNFLACAENDRASVEMVDKGATRLHLSACNANAGKLIDAILNAEKALQMATDERDAEAIVAARAQLQKLLLRVPHATFVAPTRGTEVVVKFDDRDVPIAYLTKRFSIDPGTHLVRAEGLIDGAPAVFEEELTIAEADDRTVKIELKSLAPPPPEHTTTLAAALETSGYTDTNDIRVLSPGARISARSNQAGWNIGGRYQADVISAASPDVISASSRRWKETRHVGSITGGYKPGRVGAQATANTSSEPDRSSIDAGLAVTADLRDRLIIPRLAYVYGHDRIGRTGTPFDVYSKQARTHEIEAGASVVLTPTSLLVVNGRVDFDSGDRSNPYRHVPMFDPAAAAQINRGDSYPAIDALRIPFAPLEQLPTSRQRFALIVKYNYRFESAVRSTLRLEERLYTDSWSLNATTTDIRWLADPSPRFQLGPHVRVHGQSGANFYKLAYPAPTASQGDSSGLLVPKLRTGDRELSPLFTVTFGASARVSLSDAASRVQYRVVVSGDYAHTHYFDALYMTKRVAGFGSIGIEGELD